MKRTYVILRLEGSGVLPLGVPPAVPMVGNALAKGIAPSARLKVELEPEVTEARAAEVARKKDVQAVAPVIPMKLIKPVAIQAAKKGSTWGIAAVGADTSPFTGDGVTVAVLDTGIDATHPAFAGVNLFQKNFTNESDGDLNGHGTHTAGTIFGRDVDNTRIGVAPGIKTALVGKVLGEGGGSSDALVQAIGWAIQNGANVISMSLGIDFPGLVAALVGEGYPTELATSMALEGYRANVLLFERLAALIRAQSAAFGGVCVVVAAAGNESRRNVNPDFKIAVSPPAVAEGVVSVAAVASEPKGMVIAPFSNYGARLAAPGADVLSAKLNGKLITMSGTSMATPHVAGVAALWAEKLMKSKQLTGQLFMDRLVGSGTTKGLKANFDPPDIGAGVVQAPQN